MIKRWFFRLRLLWCYNRINKKEKGDVADLLFFIRLENLDHYTPRLGISMSLYPSRARAKEVSQDIQNIQDWIINKEYVAKRKDIKPRRVSLDDFLTTENNVPVGLAETVQKFKTQYADLLQSLESLDKTRKNYYERHFSRTKQDLREFVESVVEIVRQDNR